MNRHETAASKALNAGLRPIKRFMELEAAGGILLVISAFIALIWANLDHHSYHDFFHTYLKISFGDMVLKNSLAHWINDGLMVIFFFVVGLEIKREMVMGELSSPQKAALPIVAAIGGMIAPAVIYYLLNPMAPASNGWGIPMATDIAFAVGIMSLVGDRVPFPLKIFLLALAIVDDLGAVLVIAFFYTDTITSAALGIAAIFLGLTSLLNAAGVRSILVYVILGIGVWLGFLQSGVHATIAGVILGLLTPVNPWISREEFMKKYEPFAGKIKEGLFNAALIKEKYLNIDSETIHEVDHLQTLTKESISPLDRLIHALHPWVTFLIMPVFALANAGVYLGEMSITDLWENTVTLGVSLGLLLGKPIGVVGACLLAVSLKLAQLPEEVNWTKIIATSFLAAIGFTMALFVNDLALTKTGTGLENYGKLGIMFASLLASIFGYLMLSWAVKKKA